MSCDFKSFALSALNNLFTCRGSKRYFIDLKIDENKKRRIFVDRKKIEIDGTLSDDPKPIAPIDLLSCVLAHVCSESPRSAL